MKIVFTVDEQDTRTLDTWTNDYDSKEKAINEAYNSWDYLTKKEKQHRLIEVYEDVILTEETEDTSEDRKSWHDGYDSFLTLKYIGPKELADKVWEIFSDYVPWWDREEDTEGIIREDPELALAEFLDSLRNDLEDDPENEYIQDTYKKAQDIWTMSR